MTAVESVKTDVTMRLVAVLEPIDFFELLVVERRVLFRSIAAVWRFVAATLVPDTRLCLRSVK